MLPTSRELSSGGRGQNLFQLGDRGDEAAYTSTRRSGVMDVWKSHGQIPARPALDDAWFAAHQANLAHPVVPTTGETVG